MKMLPFMMFALLLGAGAGFYYLASPEDRAVIWNSKSRSFLIVMLLTMLGLVTLVIVMGGLGSFKVI